MPKLTYPSDQQIIAQKITIRDAMLSDLPSQQYFLWNGLGGNWIMRVAHEQYSYFYEAIVPTMDKVFCLLKYRTG